MRWILCVAACIVGMWGSAHADSEPFGLALHRGERALAAKWADVLLKISTDDYLLTRCESQGICSEPARRALAIVELARTRTGKARIGEINRAVNLANRPMSDERQFGIADHWASLLELFRNGRGDCEDYALAKYALLVRIGIRTDDMRLVIGRVHGIDQDHAILAVRFNGRWLMLDNVNHMLRDEEQMLSNFYPDYVLG